MKKCLHDAAWRQRIRTSKRIRRIRLRDRKKMSALIRSVWPTVVCPSDCQLRDERRRSELLSFFSELKKLVISGQRKVCLDLSAVRHIEAHGGMLLYAEIFRLKNIFPDIKFSVLPPKNDKCHQVLTQIRLDEICAMKKAKPFYSDVIHWRSLHGTQVDGRQYAEQLMAPYKGRISDALFKSLWVGVSEAMTNVKHHAYLFARGDGVNQDLSSTEEDWWMFSQERNGNLFVIICDLGVGIPRTVPITNTGKLRSVRRWLKFGKRSDGEVLSAVLKKSLQDEGGAETSRTGMENRGRGFMDIVGAVRGAPEGFVAIHSNHAYWQTSRDKEQFLYNYRTSIWGTLISWSIPVKSA